MSMSDTLTYTKLAPHNRGQQVVACRKFVPKTRISHAILHENRSLDRKWSMMSAQFNSQRRKWSNVCDQQMRAFKVRQRRKETKWKRDDEVRINGMNLMSLDRLQSRHRRMVRQRREMEARQRLRARTPEDEGDEKTAEGQAEDNQARTDDKQDPEKKKEKEGSQLKLPEIEVPLETEPSTLSKFQGEILYKTPRYDMTDGQQRRRQTVTTKGPVLPVYEYKAPEINIMEIKKQTCVNTIPAHLKIKKTDINRHWDYCGKSLLVDGAATKDPRFIEMDRYMRDTSVSVDSDSSPMATGRNAAPPAAKRSDQPAEDGGENASVSEKQNSFLPPLAATKIVARPQRRTSITNLLAMYSSEDGDEKTLSERIVGRLRKMSMLELSKASRVKVDPEDHQD